MHKKLIRKGSAGMMASLLGNSAKSVSTPSWGLNASWQKSAGLNPQPNLPKFNTSPQLIPNSLNKPIQSSAPSADTMMGKIKDSHSKYMNDYLERGRKKAESAEKWADFKSNIKEFGSSDLGKEIIDTGVNAGLDLGLTALGKESDALDGGVNAVADVAGYLDYAVPGLGTGIKYGIKALNFADKAFGKTTKSFSGNTGISGYQDFSTQGKQFRVSQTGARKRSEIETQGNKKLFTAAKTNADALLKQQQARNQAIGNTGITNQSQLLGGQNYSVLTAKKGATLQDIRNYLKTRNIEKEVVPAIVLEADLEISEIQKFQKGGSLIPSGALHKNKHNLEVINPDLKGEITEKGIPVISYAEKGEVLEYEKDGETPKILAEGGEIIQHAEIEKDEVILDLNLSKKLVELMKKGTPEAMIEAGKLLAEELMENTTDNTGLIEKTIGNEN